MITFEQLLTGMAMGIILLVVGFVPGLLDKWAEGLADFADAILYRSPATSRPRTTFGEQRWLAALGMALMALTWYLYTAR